MLLDGAWKLYFEPEHEGMADTPGDIGEMPCIEAQVPGDAALDLVRAGLEEDPYWDQNLYNFRKYEFYHWWYVREFDAPEDFAGKRAELVLHGVNTVADVFLNGEKLGSCRDMMIEHAFRTEGALIPGERNVLSVHIRSAMNAMRDADLPVGAGGGEHCDEISALRMPPHCFGWDIMPRLLSAGLWRGVELNALPESRITQAYYATISADEHKARLAIKCRFVTDDPMLEDLTVRVRGVCGDSAFSWEQPARYTSLDGTIELENPRLWWPRGYGEQALYTVTMELCKGGEVLDARTERIGIRRIDIEHVMKPGADGQFKVLCNGVFILCKGSNWVPLSALHSQDAGRYDKALALFADMGCNIVRCWGGNVVEDHRFFDLCDELGLLVWQDFTMACATYPQERWFFDLIENEAVSIVKKLRNHASILLWAGDNEVDERYTGLGYADEHNNRNDITRDILPRVIRNHDPYRKFLPSSPYIPEGFPRYAVPEQHNWGARAYFKDDFYKHTKAHFISECGYHGCPSPETLREFLPADKLWPWHNDSWDTHNTEDLRNVRRGYNRNDLMADQVRILAGRVPDTLEEFSRLSQISQAEAKKFFVERTRILKGARTGIIWWNMLDGWPQISDAIVDHSFRKKLAYTWLRRVHVPVCLMLDETRDWGHDVVLGNDSRKDAEVDWRVEDGETGEVLLQGHTRSRANENAVVGNLRELAGTQRLYLLRWTADGEQFVNHYISGFPPYDTAKLLRWADIIERL